ncbi:LPXTG cell wall anchor domain-containing protein [Pseudonocardia kongjuensis]
MALILASQLLAIRERGVTGESTVIASLAGVLLLVALIAAWRARRHENSP